VTGKQIVKLLLTEEHPRTDGHASVARPRTFITRYDASKLHALVGTTQMTPYADGIRDTLDSLHH